MTQFGCIWGVYEKGDIRIGILRSLQPSLNTGHFTKKPRKVQKGRFGALRKFNTGIEVGANSTLEIDFSRFEATERVRYLFSLVYNFKLKIVVRVKVLSLFKKV